MNDKKENKKNNTVQNPPDQRRVRGDSLDEHTSIETANILMAEKELGQQNENN